MKLIIAGSRGFNNYAFMEQRLRDRVRIEITEVVSGGARGADRLGEKWARLQGIPIKRFLPDWDGLGRVAGFRRNDEMAEYADALAAFWDGQSWGTRQMIDAMLKLKKPAYIFTPTPEE